MLWGDAGLVPQQEPSDVLKHPGTWGDMGWSRAHGTPVLGSGIPGLDPSTSFFFLSRRTTVVLALPGPWVPPLAPAVLTEKGEHGVSQPLPRLQSMFLTQGVSAPLVAEMHLLAVTSNAPACNVF